MNIKIAPEERDFFRAELAKDPQFQETLSVIEQCDWDLESAAEVLALQEGYDVKATKGAGKSFIYDFYIKQVTDIRKVICKDSFKKVLLPGLTGSVINTLASSFGFSSALVVPLALYLIAFGTEEFCKSNSSDP